MSVCRPALSTMLCLLLLPMLLIPAVRASTLMPSSGSFTTTGFTILSVRSADGNTFIEESATIALTGTFTGTEAGVATLIVHADGSGNFAAFITFTGTVNGVSGTAVLRTVGTFTAAGSAVGIDTIISGTGNLANLHGHDTFQASLATGAGTYSGVIHFDP